MEDFDFITPQHLLLMTVEEYLRAFGNKAVSERFMAILSTKLTRNADRLRHNLIGGKPLSKDGDPLVIGDFIRIPHPYLRKVRIGRDSVHFICEALERNELI